MIRVFSYKSTGDRLSPVFIMMRLDYLAPLSIRISLTGSFILRPTLSIAYCISFSRASPHASAQVSGPYLLSDLHISVIIAIALIRILTEYGRLMFDSHARYFSSDVDVIQAKAYAPVRARSTKHIGKRDLGRRMGQCS